MPGETGFSQGWTPAVTLIGSFPRQSVHPLHTDVFDLVQDRAQDSFSNDKASCCLRISGSEVSRSFSKARVQHRHPARVQMRLSTLVRHQGQGPASAVGPLPIRWSKTCPLGFAGGVGWPDVTVGVELPFGRTRCNNAAPDHKRDRARTLFRIQPPGRNDDGRHVQPLLTSPREVFGGCFLLAWTCSCPKTKNPGLQ